MLNKTKRFISLLLCTALLCVTLVVPAVAAGTTDYIINEEFESAGTHFIDAVTYDAGGAYGKVMKLNCGESNVTKAAAVSTDARTMVFSADFYLGDTSGPVVLNIKEDTANGTVYNHSMLFQDGNFYYDKNTTSFAAGMTASDSNKRAQYTEGEWHNITIYVYWADETPKHAYIFLDGIMMRNQGLQANSAGICGVDIVALASADAGDIYVDNVKLFYDGVNSFFGEAYYDGVYLYVKTSNANNTTMNGWNVIAEPSGFSGTTLIDSNGETIGYTEIKQTGNLLVMQPSITLNKNKNYTVKLPDSMRSFAGVGGTGYSLVSNEVTFKATNGIYTEIGVDNIGLCDASSAQITAPVSGAVYADTTVVNPFESDAEVLISVAAYNDFEMTAMDSKKYIVPAADSLVVNKDGAVPVNGDSPVSVTVNVDSTDSLTLKVFVLLKTEKGYNLLGQKAFTNAAGEITEAADTFTYSGVADEADNYIMYDFTTTDKSTVIYRDVVKSNADKSFSISFNMPSLYKSGNFNLTVYEYGGAAVDYPVRYVNKDEKTTAIATINGNATQIDSVLRASSFLFIDIAIAETVDYDKIEVLVSDYMTKNGNLTEENATDVIGKAAYIAAASDGLVANVFDYRTELDFAGSSIGTFYNKSYVGEPVQGYVTSRLKGCAAETFEKFDEELIKAFVLAVVQKPDGTDNLKEVLNAFSEKIGITQNAPDSVYRALQNNNYGSFTELKSAFDKAKQSDGGSSGGGGSAGGGSAGGGSAGGGASSSGGSSVTNTVISPELKEEALPLLINIFNDIDDGFWGKTAIISLAQKDILNGKGDGCFYPDDNITREEFVKIVVKALGYEPGDGKADFKDVDKNGWYYPYIQTAVKNGIVNGYEDGSFGTGENISRQDMCVILYRAAKLAGYVFLDNGDAVFEDLQSISDYALESVRILKNEGIINGYDTGEFKPLNNSTRAECAAMMYNFLDLFNKI